MKKIALVMIISAGLGYSVGKYITPANVVEKIQVVEVEKQVVVVQKEVEVKVVKVFEQSKNRQKVVTIVEDRLGNKHTTISEQEKTDTKATVDAQSKNQTSLVASKDKETTATSERVVTTLPNWQIGASLVGSVTDFKPVYGVSVERRLFGGLYLGVLGQSNGFGGLTVKVSF